MLLKQRDGTVYPPILPTPGKLGKASGAPVLGSDLGLALRNGGFNVNGSLSFFPFMIKKHKDHCRKSGKREICFLEATTDN